MSWKINKVKSEDYPRGEMKRGAPTSGVVTIKFLSLKRYIQIKIKPFNEFNSNYVRNSESVRKYVESYQPSHKKFPNIIDPLI